jgi:hypothetical protein
MHFLITKQKLLKKEKLFRKILNPPDTFDAFDI